MNIGLHNGPRVSDGCLLKVGSSTTSMRGGGGEPNESKKSPGCLIIEKTPLLFHQDRRAEKGGTRSYQAAEMEGYTIEIGKNMFSAVDGDIGQLTRSPRRA